MNRLLRVTAAVLIVGLGAGGAFALVKSKPKPTPAAVEEESWPVAIRTIALTSRAPTLKLYGRLESPRLSHLTAAIGADVLEVPADEGAIVDPGELLVTLDARDAMLRMRQREAEAAELQAELKLETERVRADKQMLVHERKLLDLTASSVKRATDLAKRNLGSQSQLDASRQEQARQRIAIENRQTALRSAPGRLARWEARVDKTLALRDQAALDVARTKVSAPFAGRVSDVHVSPGDRVRVGDRLVSVFDYRTVEVRAQIPSRHLDAVRQGLEAGTKLRGNAFVDGTQIGVELHRLAGRVSEARGGVDGLFRLQEAPTWLNLGQTVEVQLQLPSVDNVASLPLEAIYGQDRVFRLEDDRMVGLTIERVGEQVLSSGLTEVLVRSPKFRLGDRIIVTHLPNAIDGLKVRAANDVD